MNLYLYILDGSAHAPGVLRSLTYGNVRKYGMHATKLGQKMVLGCTWGAGWLVLHSYAAKKKHYLLDMDVMTL